MLTLNMKTSGETLIPTSACAIWLPMFSDATI